MSRAQRKQQTRGDLLDAARTVFERRGFHRATLEEISAEAGYTTGAVYSAFGGKDDLFLAVLDDQIDRRLRLYVDAALDAGSFEEAGHRWLRTEIEIGRSEHSWTPLLMEFWTHAAPHDTLRSAVLERYRRQLDAGTALLEELAARHQVTLHVPPREMVRAIGALARGLGLERLIDPDAALEELYESYVMAATLALSEPAP
jgi:AcrR family transcriptional regulator